MHGRRGAEKLGRDEKTVKQKQARRVEWAETALAPEKGRDPRQWGGPAQASSTRRAPQLTITKTATSTSPPARIPNWNQTTLIPTAAESLVKTYQCQIFAGLGLVELDLG